MEQQKCGVVYILTNPSFPAYVKIGYADNLENRLNQLNNSECIPFRFRAYAIYEVDKRLADKDIHRLFDTINPNLRSRDKNENGKDRLREFFEIDPESAYQVLLSVANFFSSVDKVKRIAPTTAEKEDEQVASVAQKRVTLSTEFWEQFDKYYKSHDNLFDSVNIANNTSWCAKRANGNEFIFWVRLESASVGLTAKKDIFLKIYSLKEQVESQISEPIQWDIENCKINIDYKKLRIRQPETWQAAFEFMTNTMVTLKNCVV